MSRDLLKVTESLVYDIVRDARKKRTIVNDSGQTEQIPIDIVDRVKAADIALKFMQVKEKIDPQETQSEFERALTEYHTGSGNSASDEASPAH